MNKGDDKRIDVLHNKLLRIEIEWKNYITTRDLLQEAGMNEAFEQGDKAAQMENDQPYFKAR